MNEIVTLILITSVQGELHVLADTEFGQGSSTGSQVGPKVFVVPIQAIDLDGGNKRTFPNMGFAFAGNALTGQFTHALASTCLQNLVGATTDVEIQVRDVADVYANAAKQILIEFWRHKGLSGYGFDSVVFGRASSGPTNAFRVKVSVNHEGANSVVEKLSFEEARIHAIGSGVSAARARIERIIQDNLPLRPIEIMDSVIGDPEVPSVSGTVQLAVTTKTGVELRPVLRHKSDRAGEFTLMGVNILTLGMAGPYVPIGTPIHIDTPFENVKDFEVRD